MAGNSSRRGAVRNPGSKKGAQVGTGGQVRKGLQGRGPTPKAEERTKHPAARRARAVERAKAAPGGFSSPSRSRRPGPKTASEMVAGRNSVVEALRAKIPASTLYIAERIDTDDRVREALLLATQLNIPLLEVPRPEIDRLTDRAFHQGLALQVPPYDYATPGELMNVAAKADVAPLIVALDGVTDPRNLGAIVRSSAAFGAHGVLVPERRAAGMTAGAWKASAGAAARLRVARVPNLVRAIEELKKAGCFVVGLDGDAPTDVSDLTFASDPLVLVVGSEGKGLTRLVRENCDAIVSIPIAADTESLNAGIAAGIALYEVSRRRAASGSDG